MLLLPAHAASLPVPVLHKGDKYLMQHHCEYVCTHYMYAFKHCRKVLARIRVVATTTWRERGLAFSYPAMVQSLKTPSSTTFHFEVPIPPTGNSKT